jgi:AraC-like DNA-binding protein
MLQGSAAFLDTGQQRPLTPGDLLLVPPGLRHAIRWDEQRTSRHGYVHFSLGRRHRQATPILYRAGDRDPVGGLLRYLLWLGGGTADWEPRTAQVVDLLVTLMSSGPLPGQTTVQHPGLEAALGFVSEQWAQMPLRRLRLDELARAAAVSPTLLHRLFQAEFGLAPSAALERARLFRARALLLETSLGVEAVGIACGFADAPHFSHRCRSVLGASPRELRTGADVSMGDGVQRLVATLWSGAGRGY